MTDTTIDETGLDEFDAADPGRDPISLGDAAKTALSGMTDQTGATQDEFEGMDFAKVKFIGMSFDSLEKDIAIGDEHTFLVRARCTGSGDEEMKDGHIRHIVKMDVKSVILQEQ